MGDDLSLRINRRTIAAAFILWTAHFMIAYGAEQIAPGSMAARWIAPIAALASFAILALCWRRLGSNGSNVVRLGLAISGVAIAFQTMPAIVG
ncbi:hypothetical protein GRI97_04925 [Altererythrobacter xixiisoli]|uniref:Uncharacterized protein n=1 Tax=Croceibacterium xixiisoli TaxID=1476466 RepID=A0A6I4TQY9_9SPHN|nr:hypothetical protein [Croceibacterium xixiisoli]MXO98326.1 hypothetical protein [Croceibacterium xixiisoli]